jgi:hypothetical protein
VTFGSLYRGRRHVPTRESAPLPPLSEYAAHYASDRKNAVSPATARRVADMRRQGIAFSLVASRTGLSAQTARRLYAAMPDRLK